MASACCLIDTKHCPKSLSLGASFGKREQHLIVAHCEGWGLEEKCVPEAPWINVRFPLTTPTPPTTPSVPAAVTRTPASLTRRLAVTPDPWPLPSAHAPVSCGKGNTQWRTNKGAMREHERVNTAKFHLKTSLFCMLATKSVAPHGSDQVSAPLW